MYILNREEQKMYTCGPLQDGDEVIVNELLVYSVMSLIDMGYKIIDVQMADPESEKPQIRITFDTVPNLEAPKGFRWSLNSLVSTNITFDKYGDCTYDICASIYSLNVWADTVRGDIPKA